jgi:alpha-tubulin suppressor-like RCC1 family protein
VKKQWIIPVAATFGLAGVTTARAAGAVYEWGITSTNYGDVPKVAQTISPTAIDAANKSDLAVMSDGTVWGWGNAEVAKASPTLVQIPVLKNVSARPVDGNHDFMAIEQPGSDAACPASSSVYTWGLNGNGDLGLGLSTNVTIMTPQDVTTLDCQNVVGIAAAAQHMFALTSNGQVYVWGGNGPDVLGDGSVRSSNVPVLNSFATALTAGTATGVEVTAGSSTGGMLVNGQAYTWGNNAQGQCGCNSIASKIATPTAVSQSGVLYSVVDEGGNENSNGHELALTAAGAVYAWGDGAEGQLGQGNTANSKVPVLVPGLPVITDVRAGGMHSLALDVSGNVWAWGENANGQVGNGTLVNVLSPLHVMSGMTMISAGSLHSLAM